MWRSFLVCNPSIYLKRLGSSVARSPLAQLRKRTNLPLNKCKEALVNCDNDVVTAEKWLLEKAEKEGWLKAEKLSGRDATQGYVGVMVQRNRAVLTEVNCETDFVARTDVFKDLTRVITAELHQMANVSDSTFMKVFQEAPGDLGPLTDYKTVSDAIIKAIGQLSENIKLSHACVLEAKEGSISTFIYNNLLQTSHFGIGTYAAVLHLKAESELVSDNDIHSLGKKLAQHVVGLNPKSIDTTEVTSSSEVLLKQPFLLDNSLLVGELLERERVKVTSFVSYRLGEVTAVVDEDECQFVSYNHST